MRSGQDGQLPGINLPSAGINLLNANAAAYAEANKIMGPSGQHIEALGSDALQRWMKANGVEEMNSSYWQKQKLPTGQLALVQIQPSKGVLEAKQLGNAEISSMMFRSLEGDMQALMEKVAFNLQEFNLL